MGVLEQLNRKSGVIVGDDVLRLFEYAKQKGFAIPAIVSPECDLLRNLALIQSRTSPPPLLLSLPSRLLVTTNALLFCRSPRVVLLTSPVRV